MTGKKSRKIHKHATDKFKDIMERRDALLRKFDNLKDDPETADKMEKIHMGFKGIFRCDKFPDEKPGCLAEYEKELKKLEKEYNHIKGGKKSRSRRSRSRSRSHSKRRSRR